MRRGLIGGMAALFLLVAAACQEAATDTVTADSWTGSDGVQAGLDSISGVAISMNITHCAFNPTTANYNTTSLIYGSTLSCYLGATSAGVTPIALRVVGAQDGIDKTIPLAAGTVTPDWQSQAIEWDGKNEAVKGKNGYTVWYLMSDETESSRATVYLSFGAASGVSDGITLETATVSPDPVSFDLSTGADYYTTSLTFDLYLSTIPAVSPITKILINQRWSPRQYEVKVATAPTAAGWITGTFSLPLPGAATELPFDVWAEAADGTASNRVIVSTFGVDSSQQPYAAYPVISNVYWDPSTILIDFAGGTTNGSSVLNIFVDRLPQGKKIKSIWIKNTNTLVASQVAVGTQPTFPGWLASTWTFVVAGAGSANYVVWLEMEDGTLSNTTTSTVSFAQL
jgi:hypothetical protein